MTNTILAQPWAITIFFYRSYQFFNYVSSWSIAKLLFLNGIQSYIIKQDRLLCQFMKTRGHRLFFFFFFPFFLWCDMIYYSSAKLVYFCCCFFCLEYRKKAYLRDMCLCYTKYFNFIRQIFKNKTEIMLYFLW